MAIGPVYGYSEHRPYKDPEGLVSSRRALLADELCAMADSTHMEREPETSVSRPSTPEIAPVGAGPVSPLAINGTECEPRPRQDCPPSVWISHISSTQPLLPTRSAPESHTWLGRPSPPSVCQLKVSWPNTTASLLPSPLPPPRSHSREEVYAELIHWYQW